MTNKKKIIDELVYLKDRIKELNKIKYYLKDSEKRLEDKLQEILNDEDKQ